MKLVVDNSTTRVVGAHDEHLEWLFQFLSFEDAKAEARRRAGYGGDDRVRLFDRRRLEFPTGLLPLVIQGAKDRGLALRFRDERGPPAQLHSSQLEGQPWNMSGNWSFQLGAVEAAHSGAGRRLDGRGIIKSPTGSGKGNIAAAIAHTIDLRAGRWLFLVHRGNLARDVQSRWSELTGGAPAGFIGDGEWEVGETLTCATIQTLHAALKRRDPRFRELVDSVEGVIVDECHVAPAASFYATIQALHGARYRVGLSGTPLDRGDNRSLMAIAAIGPMSYSVTARELIDVGVLAEPQIEVIPVYQKASAQSRGDWHRTYRELIAESQHRNGAVIACMKHALDRGETPGMVFVRRTAHGRDLAKMARASGLNVEFVDGSKNTHQREKAVSDLSTGRLDFVVASKVFVEGVNVPEMRTVINAAGGKSVIEALQQVGRGTRVTKTKRQFRVYEIGDKGDYTLHDHAQERLRAYRREGYPMTVNRDVWPEKP